MYTGTTFLVSPFISFKNTMWPSRPLECCTVNSRRQLMKKRNQCETKRVHPYMLQRSSALWLSALVHAKSHQAKPSTAVIGHSEPSRYQLTVLNLSFDVAAQFEALVAGCGACSQDRATATPRARDSRAPKEAAPAELRRRVRDGVRGPRQCGWPRGPSPDCQMSCGRCCQLCTLRSNEARHFCLPSFRYLSPVV